ncbi:MAG: DUF2252 domain-containing protein [Steroidobacteraceae bacterium]
MNVSPTATAASERTRINSRVTGRHAREIAPLAQHAEIDAPAERDPVGLLLGQAQNRVPELVPIRHGRMLQSAFSFYRGAALPMAADLARVPDSGLRVQLCGDAHLSNFGAYASPDRRLVFDLNDFDETSPGPFEWDVKRLAASIEVAARANGFGRKDRRRIAGVTGREYRTAMRAFASKPITAVWYARLDIDELVSRFSATMKGDRAKAAKKLLAKARSRDSMQALTKLTTQIDGHPRFRSDPPLLVPIEEIFNDTDSEALYGLINEVLRGYRSTLQSDRRHLLDQFEVVQVARKVVGVGSVGTRAWAVLLESLDGMEPLLLQAKEAQASVLAPYCGDGPYTNQGQRVVAGQHLMQATSDIFLGWQRVSGDDGLDRDFYLRQLRDWKFSIPVELMDVSGMARYAGVCAWTLARAHARSGDRIAIAAYLGGSDKFDQAIASFASAYADINEQDFHAFGAAAAEGRVEALMNV